LKGTLEEAINEGLSIRELEHSAVEKFALLLRIETLLLQVLEVLFGVNWCARDWKRENSHHRYSSKKRKP
jgi:hypothetical protein